MKHVDPLISIGMPVYNGENFLKEAVDSILTQSFENFELIISDNGSSDKTEIICREYAQRDTRINYIRHDNNKGAAWNFNYVFEIANGKFFKWGTHDDVLLKDYLKKCVETFKNREDYGLVYPKRIVIDERGNELIRYSDMLHLDEESVNDRYKHYLKTFRYTTRWAIPILGLFRRDILKQTRLLGKFPAADTIILSEVALRSKFFEIDEYLFLHRKHPGTSNKANPTPAKIAAFYDPKLKWRVQLPRWKWLFENKVSISLAPLNTKEKLFCYLRLFQWSVLRTKSLLVDIYYGFRQYIQILKEKS
ncbi:MAG: glycosyltransferase family 2 protein [Ignavibacteriae bacterium]|nr:glycosyltransferase family 2 protein [Ignavibacteriota bacterium]NOH00333.1 glycosyltransferase family 2 protein [Ignavibacteriota bacterium]